MKIVALRCGSIYSNTYPRQHVATTSTSAIFDTNKYISIICSGCGLRDGICAVNRRELITKCKYHK